MLLQVPEPLARLSVGASCWLLNYLDTDERGPMSSGLQDTVWSFMRWQKVIPSDAVRIPLPRPGAILLLVGDLFCLYTSLRTLHKHHKIQ